MEKLTLEKYFRDKQEINFLYKTAKEIKSRDELSGLLSKLAFFLPSFVEYKNFSGYIQLAEITVDAIKELNKGDITNFNHIIDSLNKSLDKFLIELSTRIQLDIYFYGTDKYNLINKKYLKTNIYKLDDFNEVNYIKKNENKDKHFTVLLLDNSVSFASEFNIEDKFDEVFNYNKILENLFETSKTLYKCEYDFNYLKNELEASEYPKIETIVVGNGYTRTGIDKNILNTKAVNLSLPSQDLYYSFDIAKKAIDRNPNIKRCIIGVGYYSMYYNLNKLETEESVYSINEIYEPILNPEINMKKERLSLEDYITNPIILEIFNLEEISTYLNSVHYILNPDYFNSGWTRAKNSVLKDHNFELLHTDDKFSLGIWRATQHNHLINEFSKDNKDVLSNFLKYLNSKNVDAIVVSLPTTSYYRRFLDDRYEKSFNNTIQKLSDEIKFKTIDFNKGYDFNDSDFIDIDHLNERGCIKLTSYLNNLLKWLKTSK